MENEDVPRSNVFRFVERTAPQLWSLSESPLWARRCLKRSGLNIPAKKPDVAGSPSGASSSTMTSEGGMFDDQASKSVDSTSGESTTTARAGDLAVVGEQPGATCQRNPPRGRSCGASERQQMAVGVSQHRSPSQTLFAAARRGQSHHINMASRQGWLQERETKPQQERELGPRSQQQQQQQQLLLPLQSGTAKRPTTAANNRWRLADSRRQAAMENCKPIDRCPGPV